MMDENKVRSIVSNMLMSFSNTVVPQHRHNGVDSQQIPIGNIQISPGVSTTQLTAGIPLINGKYRYNFFIEANDNSLELLPNSDLQTDGLANFNIGEVGTPFFDVSIETSDEFQSNVIDGTSSNQLSQIPGVTNNAVSDGVDTATEQFIPTLKRYTATGEFAVQWPNTTLPTAIAGMFAFDAGTFYMSLSNGSWTPVPTVPGLGGTVTSVGVNAPLTATANPITTAGTISITQSTTSTNGYLSSTDWNTFNGKQSAGSYITALTGEGSASGPGSASLTLSNSAVIGKVLTGYTSGAGTVSATDSILQAIQKLNGNTAALVSSVSGTANRITTSPTTGAVIVDISATYVGQSSITTVGTLTNLTVTNAPTFSAMTSGSVLFAGTAGLLSQDNTNFFYDSTNHNLRIGPTSPAITTENRLAVIGNANDYHGIFISNINSGILASTDIVVGNDLTSDPNAYFDFGCNSSGNTNPAFTLFGASDAYIFTGPAGGLNNINIATGTTGKSIKFGTGGLLSTNERMRITDTNLTMSVPINEFQGANLASASTVNIGAATGNYIIITGSVTINAFDTVQAGTRREVTFTGTPVLTNSANLILPWGNITVRAGDSATFVSLGGGNWQCTNYLRASSTGSVSLVFSNAPTFTGTTNFAAITTASGSAQSIGGNTITIGGNSTTTTASILGGATVNTAISTVNINQGATASGGTKNVNIATQGLAGSTTNIAIGSTAGTSALTLNGQITLMDALNFALGTTTGTKIATATTQKIGFWNAAPIVQPTTAIAAATFVANTSNITNDSATFDGYTIGQIVKALRNAGLLA